MSPSTLRGSLRVLDDDVRRSRLPASDQSASDLNGTDVASPLSLQAPGLVSSAPDVRTWYEYFPIRLPNRVGKRMPEPNLRLLCHGAYR